MGMVTTLPNMDRHRPTSTRPADYLDFVLAIQRAGLALFTGHFESELNKILPSFHGCPSSEYVSSTVVKLLPTLYLYLS